MAAPTELSHKQRCFVDEYLIDLNATQAAIRAGYSAKTAQEQSSRLLSNVMVKAAVAARMKDREKRTGIEQDRVLKELARLAFFDIRRLYDADGNPIPIHKLDDDTAAAVAGLDIMEEYEGYGEDRKFIGYTKKYKLTDKTANLTLAMRHLGMLKDSLDVNFKDGLAGRMAAARMRKQAKNGSKR